MHRTLEGFLTVKVYSCADRNANEHSAQIQGSREVLLPLPSHPKVSGVPAPAQGQKEEAWQDWEGP